MEKEYAAEHLRWYGFLYAAGAGGVCVKNNGSTPTIDVEPKDRYKRRTRTGRILQHPRPIRVLALMRLNRRVPVGTHGGVRGRRFS